MVREFHGDFHPTVRDEQFVEKSPTTKQIPRPGCASPLLPKSKSREFFLFFHPIQAPNGTGIFLYLHEPGSKLLVLGMGIIPPLIGNPLNGYINPYYWVDEFIPYYMEIMGVDRPWHT